MGSTDHGPWQTLEELRVKCDERPGSCYEAKVSQEHPRRPMPTKRSDHAKLNFFSLPLELRQCIYRYLIPISGESQVTELYRPRAELGLTVPYRGHYVDPRTIDRGLPALASLLLGGPTVMSREIHNVVYAEHFFECCTGLDGRVNFSDCPGFESRTFTQKVDPDRSKVQCWILWISAPCNYYFVKNARKAVETFVAFVKENTGIKRIIVASLGNLARWTTHDRDLRQRLVRESAKGVQYLPRVWYDSENPSEDGTYPIPDNRGWVPSEILQNRTFPPNGIARCEHKSCGKDVCILKPVSTSSERDIERKTQPNPKVVSWECSDIEFLLRPLLALRNLSSVKVMLEEDCISHAYPSIWRVARDIETLGTSDVEDLAETSGWNFLKEAARASLLRQMNLA